MRGRSTGRLASLVFTIAALTVVSVPLAAASSVLTSSISDNATYATVALLLALPGTAAGALSVVLRFGIWRWAGRGRDALLLLWAAVLGAVGWVLFLAVVAVGLMGMSGWLGAPVIAIFAVVADVAFGLSMLASALLAVGLLRSRLVTRGVFVLAVVPIVLSAADALMDALPRIYGIATSAVVALAQVAFLIALGLSVLRLQDAGDSPDRAPVSVQLDA